MKKIFFAFIFVFSSIQFAQAQKLDFGIKGGINYNSDSFVDVRNEIENEGTKSKTGFHGGFWARINLSETGFYIRPEIVYTALKSEVSASGITFADYDFQKIDVPILFGKKFLKIAHAFVGPSFQYLIEGDLDYKDAFETDTETFVDGLTIGAQFGVGIELGSFGVDVRWERSFIDTESTVIQNNIGQADEFEFDTRVNQIIIGVSLKF